jgi:hypothetical protein
MCAAAGSAHTWPAPDWSQPWFAPFARDGALVRLACESGTGLPQALNRQCQASKPRFVPQADLPEGTAYEQFIFDTGTVPTREGLHDCFNGLVWIRFPATKHLLNQLQAGEIFKEGVSQVRGPVRDAITLFDENAVLFQAPDVLWEALLARDWIRLFVDLRPLWKQARLIGFGHALLEKLVSPYKSITGHVYRERVPLALGDDAGAWDRWLAERLNAAELATKPFTPMPVLGVPGWWHANEHPDFYADASVFRPPRPFVKT